MNKSFFLCFLIFLLVSHDAYARSFESWLQDFRGQARTQGISETLLDEALVNIEPSERVLELDTRQPESTKTFEEYRGGLLNDKRVRDGRDALANNRPLLEKIGREYGVQPEFIVALWGIETGYGERTGGFSIIEALATLAYDGRRSDYFRKELLNALRILDAGHIPLNEMTGSWAGAMGQCQFMPSSYLKYAVDYDRDGKADIWDDKKDIFASIANYLSQTGWNGNESWGMEVLVPEGLANEADLQATRPLSYWKQKGITPVSGAALPDSHKTAALVIPDDEQTAAFLVYDNFNNIMKWNRSRYFAAAVGLLSDKIAGH